MASNVVHMEGFRELEELLHKLPQATQRNVLRRTARGALEPMADDASAKAPHRSGKLSYSIAVSEGRTRRARKMQGRFDRKTGVQMAMGPAGGLGTLQYATFDEFGTIDTPAFGFMRAAWDGGSVQALEYVKDNLWREIDKAAQRMARKSARAIAKGL